MKYLPLLIALLWPAPALAEHLPTVTVWKSPTCGCCGSWVEHMRAAGFEVTTKNVEDMQSVKQQLGMPETLQSCHTALVGGYLIEGHVPAEDVKRLIAEKRAVKGLAVPGMPSGSPGMEDGYKDPYSVLSFDGAGKTEVFSDYR